MTISVLFLIVVIAVCAAALNWRYVSRVLFAASAALFLAIGCGLVPAWLLQRLQAAYEIKPAIQWGGHNAIVLLGGGVEKSAPPEPAVFAYPRIVEAAGLYNECRKVKADCKILISGGGPQHSGASEAAVYQNVLSRLGVDGKDVLLEPKSRNTFQNAQFTSALLTQYQVDRVVLVSSGVHLRRGVLYFKHFGVAATPVRADYLTATPSALPLSHNFTVTDFALHEYIGIIRYYLYNALGWNPPAHAAAAPLAVHSAP